jgi:hypothetical protein
MIGHLGPYGRNPSDQALFRSTQCGLCHHIGADYGFRYRLFATVDLVFFHILVDAARDHTPAVTKRACVVAPAVTALPSNIADDHTRLTAAVGILLAVEKLKDDAQDEGGWLRWALWKSFAPGGAKAREVLVGMGVPVGAFDEGMAAQAQIERSGEDLAAASGPTRAIARAMFGAAGGEVAPELGDQVGAFLFWMDNLLDWEKDKRKGGYNALHRAFPDQLAQPGVPREVADEALGEARRAVEALEPLVRRLPAGPRRDYVAHTLVDGFSDKIRRYGRLSDEERALATLRSVLPRPVPVREQLTKAVTTATATVWWRIRLALALAVMWAFPRAAFAERWWPAEDLARDTGFTPLTVAPEPLLQESLPDGTPAPAPHPFDDWVCDPCMASCGWQEVGCGEQLSDGCSSLCSNACSGVCDDACGDVQCCNT